MKASRLILIAVACIPMTCAAAAADSKIAALAFKAASSVQLRPSVQRIDTTASDLGYDLTVKYGREIDFEPDGRAILEKFAADLVAAGLDPAKKRSINVCGEQVGLKTVTGKSAVRPLGCAHYNPFTEEVTFER